MNRRRLLTLAMASLSTAALRGQAEGAGIRIAHRLDWKGLSDDDLLFLQQIGLKWVRLEFGEATNGAEPATFEVLRQARDRCARFGMKIFSGVHYSYRSKRVQLGLPGRDQDIETYIQFLRNLGKLEIPVASYDFHPANTYTTSMVRRNGYTTREFDLADFRTKVEKPAFEREYSADDIWSAYEYFVKATLPVAAESHVKMVLHPDDPPLAKMNGVAKLFTHYDGYHRAEQIAAGSPWWGLTFCVGTWSEGGAAMGKDVFEMISDFGGRGKIFEVHFRNVTGPLPHFVETFPDEGYLDMAKVMRALHQVRFTGAVEPDHVPKLAGDTGVLRAGTAYCIAYIKALIAQAEA